MKFLLILVGFLMLTVGCLVGFITGTLGIIKHGYPDTPPIILAVVVVGAIMFLIGLLILKEGER